MMFKEQAEKCRRQAHEFVGRPEGPFLLSVANAFEELATGADTRRHLNPLRSEQRDSAPRISA
jgi:hypothetical protein